MKFPVDSTRIVNIARENEIFLPKFCQNLFIHLEQGRSTSTESYIYRHRLITRSTSTSIANLANQDFHSTTSFLNYYQPAPTLINREPTQNLTEIVCPRQKNVHRNCQRSCQGSNQNTNCRHQRICACDHNCGFSCLSRC